ncbi:IclR family transcriptional regulator [Actinopolymorpha alba]|uniref:IclR family transcriptional regulator n=1 Tax=Actinopolymorpha alba TaxID=533267 RepID=UPI00037E4D43|nr:IclR family transcriptional regulator [Actinopolymorpha alba]
MSDIGLVQKTIWILRAVAAHPEGIGLSDVARASGIPKATCHRILGILEREGWLTADPDSRRFRVSLGLLFLLGGLLDQESAYGHAQSVLRDLADEAQETAGLDQLVPPSVMVVAQVQGPFLISHGLSPVPRMLPAWRTSTGKALLAWQDTENIRKEFAEDFQDNPSEKFADFDAFLAELATIRERGYSVAYNELEEGAAAVAAPVHVGNSVPYAIWIGGPTYRLTQDRIPALAESVMAAAARVGRVLEMSQRATAFPDGGAGHPRPTSGQLITQRSVRRAATDADPATTER